MSRSRFRAILGIDEPEAAAPVLVEHFDPAADAASVHATMVELVDRIEHHLPPDVVEQVTRICGTIDNTLARQDTFSGASEDMHAVVRTATDYLPHALQTYLQIPRGYAETKPVSGTRTALDILREQLTVIASRMELIYDAVVRSDTDKLIANGRFLTEKFGFNELSLGRDATPPGTTERTGPGGPGPSA